MFRECNKQTKRHFRKHLMEWVAVNRFTLTGISSSILGIITFNSQYKGLQMLTRGSFCMQKPQMLFSFLIIFTTFPHSKHSQDNFDGERYSGRALLIAISAWNSETGNTVFSSLWTHSSYQHTAYSEHAAQNTVVGLFGTQLTTQHFVYLAHGSQHNILFIRHTAWNTALCLSGHTALLGT